METVQIHHTRTKRMNWMLVYVLLLAGILSGCHSSDVANHADPAHTSDSHPVSDGAVQHSKSQNVIPKHGSKPTPEQVKAAGDSPSAEEEAKEEDPAQKSDHAKDSEHTPHMKNTPQEAAYEPFRLLGLQIHDPITEITLRFGPAQNQFTIEDPVMPITVYEYEHFLVGFNDANRLEFIEITSAAVDPELDGLRLGHSVNDITKTLGQPDVQSPFVISYLNPESVLKFDIDPKQDIILSIKLFAVK